MQPRAFVVMPFGKRTPSGFGPQEIDSVSARKIDFDRIYSDLLEPALRKAGYEVARADSEVTAGDIRTDMFFELVTADLVVADISILNPNVYYELGVRHGVCPRGVFIVNANVMPSRPFDVAPDRSFSYEAAPFIESSVEPANGSPSEDKPRSREEVERLAKKFQDASSLDRETVGSPVYSHLPGLKPVDWDAIETSKAKYFNALQNDWLECVQNAQADGHPGDILTLAMNAPTRLHESRILYEAATALINLCRYTAAENVLSDVIQLNPEHTDAQMQLALVLSHLGKTTAAEHQLRKILEQHKADPRAADLLGQVFRHLWHLSWQAESVVSSRREKAKEACPLAISAIHSFSRAHRTDPRAYFAGFNALMLAYVLCEIGIPQGEVCKAQARESASIDLKELKTLVRYAAQNEQRQAVESGNYVQQFWCTTTLAGIHLIDGDSETAMGGIREACAIPAATSFQMQTFRDRLELLAELEVGYEFVQKALNVVDRAMTGKSSQCGCERVFLWQGYGIDHSKRETPRFPATRVSDVAERIKKALEQWNLNANDLAICGGMTESDIIFAETCLELGARVRLMIRQPIADERSIPLWPGLQSLDWHERLHRLLLRGDRKEIWLDTRHLGAPPGSNGKDLRAFVTMRHKQWLINTAKMEATAIMKPRDKPPKPQNTKLHGLFLWDGSTGRDDPEGLSNFIREVNEFEDYSGLVMIISPEAKAAP